MRSFWEHGIVVASASDYPVPPPLDPLVAIQRGVMRRDPADPDEPPLWLEEAVTVEQMVESFTISGAYAMGLEAETGSIEVGKAADLVALDRDLMSIPPEEIADAKVELTVFGGRPVYAAGPFAGLTGD
jgi:predicted amidohydrolase YtcJ